MKLSAITFALILAAVQRPALGDDIVVAAEDEYATNSEIEGPVEGPAVDPVGLSAAQDSVVTAELAEFERLFGSASGPSLTAVDQTVAAKTSEMAWPWWMWPVGLFALGVLLIVRGRINRATVPVEAIKVVSRQTLGKDGTLALVEVHDGDSRKRRLLVGLGGGAPRLVADVSAWEVAVAAPSNITNDAVAVVGPDPDVGNAPVPLHAAPNLRVAPKPFDAHLASASQRFEGSDVGENKADLIEEVLAHREQVRRESADVLSATSGIRKARRKPTYSSREVLA